MSNKQNEIPMEELISKVAEFAKGGDSKAQELMNSISGFRFQAEMVINGQELVRKNQEADQKRLKIGSEIVRKNELSQWVSGIARGEGVETRQLATSDLDLISKHHIGVFETDVVELNKIIIGPNGPQIAKGWCEDFQRLIFPDGKEGTLQVKFDNEGMVSDMRIKRK